MGKDHQFRGVLSIAPTPFFEDGRLDLDSVETLVDFYVAKRVHGLIILGVMGEADKLLPDERVKVIEAYIRAVSERIPVLVGTTHAGTIPAIALAKQAEQLGAAGIMIAPPPVSGSNVDLLVFKHYIAINNAVSIPIVIQDYPPSSGVRLSPLLLAQMTEKIERVLYLKLEDPPTPVKLSEVRRLAGDRLAIFGGLGGVFYYEELEQGALGTMTGFAYPEILVKIYDAYTSGNKEHAALSFYNYLPLLRFEFQPEIGLAIRKEVFQRRGVIKTAATRDPSTALDDNTARELTNLLARLKLA